jgi:nicotinate-nucleotide adenylyltransferase
MVHVLENEYIKVSKFEIQNRKISYTINTLKQLKGLYPQDTFYWIIGSDQLADMNLWKNWEELITEYNFIIFPRNLQVNKLKGYVKSILGFKTIPTNFYLVDNDKLLLTDISSTIIRNCIKAKKSILNMVPEKVEEYIIKKKLYK